MNFFEDFPTKYVCAVNQLKSRGYIPVCSDTNGVLKNNGKYKLLPNDINNPYRVNPLYVLVEGKVNTFYSLNYDVAKIFNVYEKIISVFSMGIQGVHTYSTPIKEKSAERLGWYFREKLFGYQNDVWSSSIFEAYFKNFNFNKCQKI